MKYLILRSISDAAAIGEANLVILKEFGKKIVEPQAKPMESRVVGMLLLQSAKRDVFALGADKDIADLFVPISGGTVIVVVTVLLQQNSIQVVELVSNILANRTSVNVFENLKVVGRKFS